MAHADVLEFTVPEAHHHRLELIGQAFARDQADLQQLEAQLAQSRQQVGARLTGALQRLLVETVADKLPEGKVPPGAQLLADWKARTVSVRMPPAQPKGETIEGKVEASEPKPTPRGRKGKLTKLPQGTTQS